MKYFATLILILFVFAARSQNLHTHSNAVNITNEANSTNGWTGAATITSVTTNPQNGTYSMRIVSTSTGGREAQYTFNATVGTTYNISIWARRGATFNNPAFANWVGLSGFATTTINTQNWVEYTFTVSATQSNPIIRVYTAPQGAGAGFEVFLDAVSITAAGGGGGGGNDTQPPTAPTNLTASNTTSSSTNLNWGPSTDNVGVTEYQIRRNNQTIGSVGGNATSYNATGLAASTTYSFNVVALDAAGNISPPSNTVQVTTTSGGGGGTGEPYTTLNANLPSVNWQSNNYYAAGNVGIGTNFSNNYRLAVNGVIRAKEVIVESGWSDFVFEDDYYLPTLQEVEKYIEENGHLKDIPSAAEVQENGVGLAEISTKLLQKIEELTLYLIAINKRIEALESTLPATTNDSN